ncbi:translation initiation factor IF-2-like isoform X3 [Panicum virgatum]|uniref:translation initiation factor IF-2-like isoform X3 n=1 Tax=Panicum virgatum TaxID=38727 RepID=UPI0019D64E60|nr:translation initiation factor IF-2-like isoform X3 [Panicum virgatum]
MPVLGRAGQPPSPRRSSPPGSGEGAARSTGGAGRAASWSSGSSPPGSGEGVPRGAAAPPSGSGEGRGWAGSGGRGCRAGVAPPPCLPVRDRKDGHAAMLTKEELLVPISLARSLRELRRMYYSAPVLEARPECRRTPLTFCGGEHQLPQNLRRSQRILRARGTELGCDAVQAMLVNLPCSIRSLTLDRCNLGLAGIVCIIQEMTNWRSCAWPRTQTRH